MSSATMTLIGLYNFDNTIFDNLQFPAGIDKTTAVNEILMRSGEFEILYPDITFLKVAIEHWGKKHYRTFEKWFEALAIEFEPLYNYDRYEEYTDEKVSQGSQSRAGSESSQNILQNSDGRTESSSGSQTGNDVKVSASDGNTSGSETSTGNSISGTGSDTSTLGETERFVSAYDAGTYQPREKETNSNGTTGLGDGYAANQNSVNKSDTTSGNASEALQHSAEDTQSVTASGSSQSAGQSASNMEETASDNRAEQMKHTAHLYGNIGVTTSTQMLEDFLRVERFSIFEQIADIFVDEFCIMVY